MENLKNDIKTKDFKRVYLLFGEEGYLVKYYKTSLINAITNGDTMNVSYYEGKKLPLDSIVNEASTAPFFADKRLIVIENSGLFKSCSEKDPLLAFLANIPESTCIIFVESETDKRSKYYKAVKNYGYPCEFEKQKAGFIKKWVNAQIAREKINITEAAYERFLEYAGTDLYNISNELTKLLCYTKGKEYIDVCDVTAICIPEVSENIFSLIDAIGDKDLPKAMREYDALIAAKVVPNVIMSMLIRQFNIMLKVYELKKKGLDSATIAKMLGLQPFVVVKAIKQSDKYSDLLLCDALEYCVSNLADSRTGKLSDKTMVEDVIVKYASA